MANEVIASPYFEQKLKRLIKKYPSLIKTILILEDDLIQNPRLGDSYGQNIYKIRIPGEGKGKSGGYRVITYVVDESEKQSIIRLATIFTKAEESTITKADAVALIKNIFK